MLSVKQGSCEYQFQSHWFDPTRNETRVYSSRDGRSHYSAIGAVLKYNYKIELLLRSYVQLRKHSSKHSKHIDLTISCLPPPCTIVARTDKAIITNSFICPRNSYNGFT